MAEAQNLAGKVKSAQIAKTQAHMSGEARRLEYEGGGAEAVAASTTHRMTEKNTSEDKDLPTMFSQEAMRARPLFYQKELEAIKRAETANIALGASLASKAGGGATSAGAKGAKVSKAWAWDSDSGQAYNAMLLEQERKANAEAAAKKRKETEARQKEFIADTSSKFRQAQQKPGRK
jgi:hypothetical protein